MVLINGKWKHQKLNYLSYRKSESVNILDLDLVPKKFIKKKVEVSADKTEIKKALKEGVKVKGAELTTNYNMQVK